MFEGTGLEYELTSNQVVIIRKAPIKAEKVERVTLTGVVKDKQGGDIAGRDRDD